MRLPACTAADGSLPQKGDVETGTLSPFIMAAARGSDEELARQPTLGVFLRSSQYTCNATDVYRSSKTVNI